MLQRLQALLADLIAALCHNDPDAIEQAASNLHRFVEAGQAQLLTVTDGEAIVTLQPLLEAAQCLVWARLLYLVSAGSPTQSALVGEYV
ncbi:hypothetical protein HRbin17_02653 [bacterium HR17]|jgi:hypothetical protein|uniref:Uncharacterized protein n=1 Tax=Candidatus Fervidibacter japonicus TaxID=2035412 RepID=A0A2H5XG15_9BACT|nr:hypothetical protein HRbin17_02653 [bacterium HR17]